MSAQVKITIGAVKDRSVDVVFDSIEKRAKKSGAAVNAAFGGGSGGDGAPRVLSMGTRAARALAQELARVAAAGQATGKTLEQSFDEATKSVERNADGMGKSIAAGFRKGADAADREAKRAKRSWADKSLKDFAQRTSHRASRFFWPNAPITSMARTVAVDMLRGAGVDLNLGSSIQRATSLETSATGLANQVRVAEAALPSDKRTNVTAAQAIEFSRKLANDYRVAPETVSAGLGAYVGKTGSYAEAQATAPMLLKLARSTNTDFVDMSNAAALASNQIGDVPNKSQVLSNVMHIAAAQGAVGAVEISDLASQFGRIAANASMFAGDKAANITKLSALTQLAMATGGATSPQDAARATAGFGSTLQKRARIAAFQNAGIDIFTDKKQNKLKDPFEIIKEAIIRTNGNIPQLAGMFADVIGRKPVTALANAYREAGGGGKGSKGENAIDKELAKYSVNLSDAVEDSNLAETLNTTASRAQLFQNQLDALVAKLSSEVMPQMEQLAPKLLNVVSALGSVISWAAANPGEAAAAALVASIARAGIESGVRFAIEKAILASPIASGGLAIAIATATVGMLVIDNIFGKKADEQRRAAIDTAKTGQTLTNIKNRGGVATPEEKAFLEKSAGGLEESNAKLKDEKSSKFVKSLLEFNPMSPTGFSKDESSQQYEKLLQTTINENSKLLTEINTTLKGNLKISGAVAVTNPAGLQPPPIPSEYR